LKKKKTGRRNRREKRIEASCEERKIVISSHLSALTLIEEAIGGSLAREPRRVHKFIWSKRLALLPCRKKSVQTEKE